MKKIINIILIILLSQFSFSQVKIKNLGTIPFIKNYTPEQYNAARQNWAGVQDKRGLLYFGNSNGSVIEFDGQNWNLINISESSITALNVDYNNKIYIGGDNVIGYLMPSKNGSLAFKSIKNKLPNNFKSFEKIWDIFITEDSTIFFQTFNEIFLYKNDSIKVLSVDDYFSKGLFLMSFQIDEEIYIYTKYKGLYKLVGDKLVFIDNSKILASSMVRAILPFKNKENIIFTWYDGVFTFKNNKLEKITTPIDNIIIHNTFRVIDIRGKYFGFQLYSGGFLITDKNFNIIQFLSSPSELNNDKIYRAFFDNQDNLWFCTDNGIASTYLFSPFSNFDKLYGFDNESTFFDAYVYENNFFAATASGLYFRKWKNFENKLNPEKFKLIKNDRGNIKTQLLKTAQNDFLAASSSGLYKISPFNIISVDSTPDNYQAKYILDDRAIKDFIVSNTDSNTIIGVSTSVVFIFKKINGLWTFIKDFHNFGGENIAQDKKNTIWVSDQNSGVFRLKFDKTFENITENYSYPGTDSNFAGLPDSINIKVFNLADKVVFTTKKGIYYFNYKANKFVLEPILNKLIGKNIYTTNIYLDSKGNYWYKEGIEDNKSTTWLLRELKKTDTGYTLISKPFLFLKNNIFSFKQISNHEWIIGGANGFVHYDDSIPFREEKQFPAFIRSVKISGIDSVIFNGNFIGKDSIISNDQTPGSIIELPYKYGNLRFTFSGSFYQSPDKILYTFYLEGNDSKWDWTSENYKDYSNLKPGEYTFWVKAKNQFNTESSIAKYSFVIKPPWYLTIVAFIIYFVLSALLIWLIVYLYTLRLRKQKEYLEDLVKQRTQEIEQQKHEIEAQRDQLAISNDKIQKINKDITDSIEYAKRIQNAMLPLLDSISQYLKDYFILFKPRDIVSGDFYWFSHKKNKSYISAVDCTGHGVPGAFMSMIGADMLTTIVNNKEIEDPAEILELQNKYVRDALKQDETENQDGMDMALCVIDQENNILEFAGAKNPLFYIQDGEIIKIKGNRQSIGGFQFDNFVKHTIKYKSPTWFYIFSDGYADQFGGETEQAEKFMIKKFKDILLDIYQKPMEEQHTILDNEITKWMKNTRQTDDILVIGFKL